MIEGERERRFRNERDVEGWKLDDRSFYAGVLVALEQVAAHGNDTLYDEIVERVGPVELYAEARRNKSDIGHMRRFGWTARGEKR